MAEIHVKKFKDLADAQLEKIINEHFNHWSKFNPKMERVATEDKFRNLYTKDDLPFGIALFDAQTMVGFCVFKLENLKKYPNIFPWLSDVMIFEEFRRKGYGRKLLEFGQKVLKDLGFEKVYVWTDKAPVFYQKLGFEFEHEVEKNEGGVGQLYSKEI